MLVGPYPQVPGQVPRWPFAFDADSGQARGAVLVAPFLQGLPPTDLVKGRTFAWTSTEPSSAAPVCLQGRPVDALAIDGNGAGYITTSDDYGLPGVNTLTVEWWMSEDGNYLAGDGSPYIASNRTAGNAGWSAGRSIAAAGPPGNATRLQFVIQGVAAYTPVAHDIPARKWVHACITLEGTSLTMYVDGVSVHTATTGSMTTGGSMVLFGQGPSGASPWVNNVHSLVVRRVALTAAEVRERADPGRTFGLYYELGRKSWFLPGASGGAQSADMTNGISAGASWAVSAATIAALSAASSGGDTLGGAAGSQGTQTNSFAAGATQAAAATSVGTVTFGATSGATWSALAGAFATLSDGAAQSMVASTSPIQTADMSAGTALGAGFAATAAALASVATPLTATDVMAAVASAVAQLTAGAELAATWVAQTELITDGVALFATVSVVPALQADASVGPALTATVQVTPALRGRIQLH